MVKKVLLASPRGYCAGVERAVETVEKALDLYGPPVYVRKQIVHNLHVVRDLEARGAIFVDDERDAPPGATEEARSASVKTLDQQRSAARPARVARWRSGPRKTEAIHAYVFMAPAILGLLPASLATGLGSDVQRPLATVIVWGLFSATALTLFVVPVGYRLLVPGLPEAEAPADQMASEFIEPLPDVSATEDLAGRDRVVEGARP